MNMKIRNPGDLERLRERAREDMELRTAQAQILITVHLGTCGIAAGARDMVSCLMDELARTSATRVGLRQSSCAGLCDQEPMLTLTDQQGREFRYGNLDANRVRDIVRQHVVSGTPIGEYLIGTDATARCSGHPRGGDQSSAVPPGRPDSGSSRPEEGLGAS